MSSEGVFVVAEDGELTFVEISEAEFLASVGPENVVLAGQFDGEEFYPQAGLGSALKTAVTGGAKAIGTAIKTTYRNVYKYIGGTTEKSIAKEVTSIDKIANIERGTGSLSKGAQLATFDRTMLSKADELQSAVSASAKKLDTTKILRAGEAGDIAEAKVALAKLDTVITDPAATKLMSESELTVFKASRQNLDDALKGLEKPVALTGEGGSVAREQLIESTKLATSTIDDAGKFRMNNWSILREEIPGLEKAGLETEETLLRKAATKTDDVIARERALAEEAAAAERKLAEEAAVKAETSVFGKISRSSVAKYGAIAGATLVGASAIVGIVSAGGLGGKAGVTPSSDVLEKARETLCGNRDAWANTDQPEKYLAACRNCVVTGDETEDEVAKCFYGKVGTIGQDPCADTALDANTKSMCVACQKEVADPANVDQLVACIQGKVAGGAGGAAGGAGGGAGGAAGGGAGTTGDICDDSGLDAETLAMCKACQKISSDPQDVDLISKCIIDKKSAAGGSAEGDVCESSGLDAETLALCKECQKTVSDAQDVTLLAECITNKRAGGSGAVTGDICDTSGLDTETLALCKTCQGEVTDPQNVTLVSECIKKKVASPVLGATTPCDDSRAQLTDEEYRACVDCYVDGMAIDVLQNCMIEMLAKTVGEVPVCDINDPSFNLSTCIGKICNPDDALYDQDACNYYTGIAEQPYYGGTEVVQDTMDPCDTTSQMFDATKCTELGGEVYTSEVQAEAAPNMVFPILLLGGAAAALVMGFRGSGPAQKKR